VKPRHVPLILIGWAAVALETTLSPRLAVGGVRPDLVLAMLMFTALFVPAYPALLGAWVLGLAKDVTGGGPVGVWALLFLGAAALVIEVRDLMFIERALTQVILTAVVSLGTNAGYVAARCALSGTRPSWAAVGLLLGGAVYTALVTPAILRVLGRWRRALGLAAEQRIA
jgi:rod shape-determining protein MreD